MHAVNCDIGSKQFLRLVTACGYIGGHFSSNFEAHLCTQWGFLYCLHMYYMVSEKSHCQYDSLHRVTTVHACGHSHLKGLQPDYIWKLFIPPQIFIYYMHILL